MIEYSDKYKPQQITSIINDKIKFGEKTELLLILI